MRWTETLRWFGVWGFHAAERLTIPSLVERVAEMQSDWQAKLPFFVVPMGRLRGFQRLCFPLIQRRMRVKKAEQRFLEPFAFFIISWSDGWPSCDDMSAEVIYLPFKTDGAWAA